MHCRRTPKAHHRSHLGQKKSAGLRRKRSSGFTLTELMVIVLVIGVMSSLAIPSIQGAMAERRARAASIDLVLMARRGRAEAAAFGRAHVLRWNNTNNGTFNLYRGRASSCNARANDWLVLTASNCAAANPGFCVEQSLATDYQMGSTDVLVTESTGRGFLDICFEPGGRVTWRNGAGGQFTDRNFVNGAFRFVFQRRENGAPTGVARTIIVPLGANARELR